MFDARQMGRQGLTAGAGAFGFDGWSYGLLGGGLIQFRLHRRQVFGPAVLEQILLDLCQGLALGAIAHPPQMGQFQDQGLDLDVFGVDFRILGLQPRLMLLEFPLGLFLQGRDLHPHGLLQVRLDGRGEVQLSEVNGEIHGRHYTLADTLKPAPPLGFRALCRNAAYTGSGLPIGPRQGPQAAPIDPRHQPVPLCLAQGKTTLIARRPDEAALVQTPLAQPHPGAVPHQQLQPIAGPVAEHERRPGTRRMAQGLLHDGRQTVDPPAHGPIANVALVATFHRLHRHPNRRRRLDQPRHCNSSASHRGDTDAGISSRWPWPRCRTKLSAADASGSTRTGIRT